LNKKSKQQSNIELRDVEESQLVNPVLVIDTETTGLIIDNSLRVTKKNLEENPDNFPRVVQLAYMLLDPDGKNCSYSTYVKQNEPIPEQAVSIHGITAEYCNQHGVLLVDALTELAQKATMCDTIIGYNVRFDYKVLQAEYLKEKIGFPFRNHNKIDAMRTAQKILKKKAHEKISLNNAHREILGDANVYESSIDLTNRHDAMSDVVSTALIHMVGKELNI